MFRPKKFFMSWIDKNIHCNIFQITMNRMLEGVPGVICHMDDVLIHGTTREEHDQRVHEVMERIQRRGMTLNNKCEFSKTTPSSWAS